MNDFLKRYEEWGFPQTLITPKRAIRINTLYKDAKQILKSLDTNIKLTRIPFVPNGYYVETEVKLPSSPQFLKGDFYIQETASQVASVVLDPKETDTVLDMCAAPGSKTTHLAQLMNNKGKLVANDNRLDRVRKLCFNLERCGVTNTTVLCEDGLMVRGSFDRILLDAPCSGNFITDKNWFGKRSIFDIKQKSSLQKQLLKHGIRMLKEGGTIVYATCSLEKEENEDVVEAILETVPSVSLVEIDIAVGEPGLTENTKLCKRFWPSHTGTQGFFIAKFIKSKN